MVGDLGGIRMKKTRIERDALGEMELPEGTMYGINTARALENFPLGHKRTRRDLSGHHRGLRRYLGRSV